jgi:hypothetical protein
LTMVIFSEMAFFSSLVRPKFHRGGKEVGPG